MLSSEDYQRWEEGLLAGTDLLLNTSLDSYSDLNAKTVKNDLAIQNRIKESLHYTLYAYVNSNLMNGVTDSTSVDYVLTVWQKGLIGVDVLFGVLTVLPVPKFEHPSVSGKASRSTLAAMTPSASRSGAKSTALPVSKYRTPSICTHCARPSTMPEATLSFSTAAPSSVSAVWGAAASSIGMSGEVSAAASGTSAAMAASLGMLLLIRISDL